MNTEERIIDLLTETPQLRDDDNKLIASFWSNEMNSDIRSANDFLMAFYSGHFTSAETIRRTRQRVQQTDPYLRGSKYKDRQKYQKKWISKIMEIQPTESQESLF
jgi:hypothetical protein